jgi:hypothetical protein
MGNVLIVQSHEEPAWSPGGLTPELMPNKNVVKDEKTQSGEDLKNRTGKALT